MTLLLKTYLNYTFHLLHSVLHDLPKNHKKLYPDLKTQKIVLEYKLQEANLMEKGIRRHLHTSITGTFSANTLNMALGLPLRQCIKHLERGVWSIHVKHQQCPPAGSEEDSGSYSRQD